MMQTHDVKVVEVGPRDGLQNEKTFVATELKVALIKQLQHCGLQFIEAGSFVAPHAIPQLKDSDAVFHALEQTNTTAFSALVPNKKGLERALAAGVKHIALFASCSETFSQKNINCSIDESFERFEEISTIAKDHHISIRGYLSCVLGCPYEGKVNIATVATLAERLLALGADEISFGDTIGVGNPKSTTTLIEQVKSVVPLSAMAMHFHDTYGLAIANIYASLEAGIRVFDSSVAGLGGCPYAKGASGNVASEDVVHLLHELGFSTGIDLNKLVAVGNNISQQLKRANQSKVAQAIAGKQCH